MFCPNCGQERISTETSFCSRCGYLLTGTAELLNLGGLLPSAPAKSGWRGSSARARGLKQGLFIFLLSFLVVPLMGMLTLIMNIEPFPVAISAIVLTVGGLLRMVWALMFESPYIVGSDSVPSTGTIPFVSGADPRQALPPQQSYPASAYTSPAAGQWRDTRDLQPTSVTESTTRLLEEDEFPRQ